MKVLCIFVSLLILVSAQLQHGKDLNIQSQLDALSSKLDSKQIQIDRLTARLDDQQNAEVLFYVNRATCPTGYYPLESAYGRILVIDGENRGRVSDHTVDDQRKVNVDCTEFLGVAENGMSKVCSHSNGGTELAVDLNDLLPYVKMMACSRNDGPSPVIP